MKAKEQEESSKAAYRGAHEWFSRAVDMIDKKFKPGYAKQHPELIAALINSMAISHQSYVRSIDDERRQNAG